MAETVLDASAVLAHLRGEAGGDRVSAQLSQAVISAVNLSEVVSKLLDLGASETAIMEAIDRLPCIVADFTPEQAVAAGLLRSVTRKAGLSLGDRACLALAGEQSLPALTTDKAWTRLDVGVEVVLIR